MQMEKIMLPVFKITISLLAIFSQAEATDKIIFL